MNAEEARRFIVGKLFSFKCFDGTSGIGRVYSDGSASGIIQFAGRPEARYVKLPTATLRARGETVCALLDERETCFDLDRTDAGSFRGAISGLGLFSCQFTAQNEVPKLVESAPLSIKSERAGRRR
jgi:hypothetical protein